MVPVLPALLCAFVFGTPPKDPVRRQQCTPATSDVQDALTWMEAIDERLEAKDLIAVRRGIFFAQRSLATVVRSDTVRNSYARTLLLGSARTHLDEAAARLSESKPRSLDVLVAHARISVAVACDMACSPLSRAEDMLEDLSTALDAGALDHAALARNRALAALHEIGGDASLSSPARDEALAIATRLRGATTDLHAADAATAIERAAFATQGLCVAVAAERMLALLDPSGSSILAHVLGQLYEVEATAGLGDEVHTNTGLSRAAQMLSELLEQSRGTSAKEARTLLRKCLGVRDLGSSASKVAEVQALRRTVEGMLFDIAD